MSDSTRELDRYAYAHDASHYLLIPESISTPAAVSEISELLSRHSSSGVPVTFRSGGTSLSGQSLSDSVLVDTRKHFKKIEIHDSGAKIVVQPGITVREINNRLKPYGYKFGPDPASEIAATVGGVIANNSSGMVCGTSENAYKTILSAVIIFSDGSSLDTSSEGATQRLRELQPNLFSVIEREYERIQSSPHLYKEIERQYRGKNTMGYSLNAFLDFSDPIDILLHLMVGSEGTLAYIAEATFRTIPLKPFAATNLLVFNSLKAANESLSALVNTGAAAVELLDKTSLQVSQRERRAMPELKALSISDHAALIVEYQELTNDQLQSRIALSETVISNLALAAPAMRAETLSLRNDLWHIRKGLYATVAGARKPGTTALLEDVAVPVASLAATCEKLIELFVKHQYHDSVIFGHAKDGNIHFMLNEDFRESSSQNRYRDFTEEMVDLVLDFEGTLKAEHGTGRVMAPFVRKQFGDELYEVMVALKRAFDPKAILNPDVIITENPSIHLINYKISPTVEAEVDRCVECGFCEPGCPSKNLTLTPRQRITTRRALVTARTMGDAPLVKKLETSFAYDGIDTCAVDGICAISCPVGINTGDLVRNLRSTQSSAFQAWMWGTAARYWSPFLRLSRTGVQLASVLPKFRGVKLVAGAKRTSSEIPDVDLVYLPSCTNELFGPTNQPLFVELCELAGLKVYTPSEISSMCCSTPWKSKGMSKGLAVVKDRNSLIESQLQSLGVPVVTDSPSCTDGFNNSFRSLKVLDTTEYLAKVLIAKLPITKIDRVVVHPTCSSAKIDENASLFEVAHAIADEVIVPPNWGCCAFAGDRGLLHPELTKSATEAEAEYVKSVKSQYFISNNRTCEMAMTAAVGSRYVSVLQLLHDQIQG